MHNFLTVMWLLEGIIAYTFVVMFTTAHKEECSYNKPVEYACSATGLKHSFFSIWCRLLKHRENKTEVTNGLIPLWHVDIVLKP